jgi:hypothetical protein
MKTWDLENMNLQQKKDLILSPIEYLKLVANFGN